MNVPSFSREGGRSIGLWLLLAALAAAFAGTAGVRAQQKKVAVPLRAAVVVQQAVSDEQFDQWIFQQDRNAAGARKRLEALVALQVEEIDRACELTDAQKKKVQLTARGDVVRFFNRYEELKQKFQAMNTQQDKFQEIWQDIRPLQMILQAGLFHDDSFLYKSLRHTLTDAQLGQHQALVRERSAFSHRATIELGVTVLEQATPLRDAQRRELIALLVKETKPPRKSGLYDYQVTMFQLGRVPEGKLKPLFDNTQWKAVSQLLDQFRGLEPFLRQVGQWPDEDAEADRIEVRPPAPKNAKE